MSQETIKLGKHEGIPVYPQKWAYLVNRTGKVVFNVISSTENLGEEENFGELLFKWAGTSTYQLLVALIPTVGKRIPEYEFQGYGSREAFDAQDYDEELDDSPTLPEIIEAFNVAVKVNRFDLVKVLKEVVDPKQLRAEITERLRKAISEGSLNSQLPPGGSTSTNSTTNPPTSKEKEESLSQD